MSILTMNILTTTTTMTMHILATMTKMTTTATIATATTAIRTPIKTTIRIQIGIVDTTTIAETTTAMIIERNQGHAEVAVEVEVQAENEQDRHKNDANPRCRAKSPPSPRLATTTTTIPMGGDLPPPAIENQREATVALVEEAGAIPGRNKTGSLGETKKIATPSVLIINTNTDMSINTNINNGLPLRFAITVGSHPWTGQQQDRHETPPVPVW